MKPWPTVRLGEVLTPTVRGESVDASKEYRLLGIRLDGQGPFLRETVMGTQTSATKLFRVAENDFIYSRLFACRGAFGVISKELDGCYVSGEFPAFVPVPGKIDVEYLKYWFRLPSVIATVDADCSGSTPLTRNRFKENFFLALEIPLPPLAEQRRVVTRIEELAAQIHEARTLRHQSAEEAEALTGSNASELFLKCSKRQPIEALAEVRGGIQKGPHRAPGANPVRYLTVAHVHRNKILTDSPRYFEVSPQEFERWRLLRGDVLIIEGNGSADQIGRAALFRGEIENCVHQNHVIRIRPDKQHVLPEFLNTFLNSPAGQDAVQGQSRTSSGLRSLSIGRIKSICVPVPPLAEQRRIVGELDALQAEVDALKCLQAETAAELAALLPAILDRAFKGEL